jgi:hypothetical protein
VTGGRLDYSKLTDEIFETIIAEIVIEKGTDLLQNPKIYTVLCEELNDDVLERWEKKQAHVMHNAELLNEWEKMEEEKLLKEEEEEKEKKEEKME